MHRTFSVIGGDMRLAKLAELLAADGHSVFAFAIDKIKLQEVQTPQRLEAALSGADCVILPLPVSVRAGFLNTPLSTGSLSLERLFGSMSPGQLVCAGRVDETAREAAARYGIELVDYFQREELAVLNAAATAEGAIQLAMEETPITISGSKCLVIGYGRIGKLLSRKLSALGAQVTVSARNCADRAWISACGYTPADTNALEPVLGQFDIVFNTVPARVLGPDRLSLVDQDCLCMDLASKPGGLDFAAAAKLGIKAIWALSLPGEVAPTSSGAIIRDTIYNILEERRKLQ